MEAQTKSKRTKLTSEQAKENSGAKRSQAKHHMNNKALL